MVTYSEITVRNNPLEQPGRNLMDQQNQKPGYGGMKVERDES